MDRRDFLKLGASAAIGAALPQSDVVAQVAHTSVKSSDIIEWSIYSGNSLIACVPNTKEALTRLQAQYPFIKIL